MFIKVIQVLLISSVFLIALSIQAHIIDEKENGIMKIALLSSKESINLKTDDIAGSPARKHYKNIHSEHNYMHKYADSSDKQHVEFGHHRTRYHHHSGLNGQCE